MPVVGADVATRIRFDTTAINDNTEDDEANDSDDFDEGEGEFNCEKVACQWLTEKNANVGKRNDQPSP